MRLEDELRQLLEGTKGAPWPGEQQAFDRFLRRRARRGRMAAATAGLALVAVLGAAVLVARPQPKEQQPVAPAGGVVRVPTQGFELAVPAGWKLQRQLTGPGSQVVGVVLVPRSGQPHGAAVTVTAHDDQELTPQQLARYTLELQMADSQRADGRLYKLLPGRLYTLRSGRGGHLASGKGPVGPYVIAWHAWPPACRPLPVPAGQPPACARATFRVLLVTGAAAPGDAAAVQQVLGAMRRIVDTARPIGNALPPPGAPGPKVLLGKGGRDRGAWEAWIEPTPLGDGGPAGFMVRFPRATPKPTWQWQPLEPRYVEAIQRDGVSLTHSRCLSWLPGADLVLSGLAREEVASVRIELVGRSPVEVSTFGRDKPVPWVAFVSPPLPPGAKLDRVVALDATGKTIGSQRSFQVNTLCRPRAG
jgi:hypothetical protein